MCFRQWILADGGESGVDGIAVSGVEVVTACIPWNSFSDFRLQQAQFDQDGSSLASKIHDEMMKMNRYHGDV